MTMFKNFYKNNQNFINKRFVILGLLISPFLFRQGVYRSIITYKINQERIADTQLDAQFERFLLTHPDIYDRQFDDIDKIIHIALKVTSETLSHKSGANLKTDPLSTFRLGETNNEGFAAFFTAVCSYLIQRHHFSDDYSCQQFIAERLKGGVNLKDAFQSPYGDTGLGSTFEKTRDVAGILEKATGRYKYVDPTIFEQFSIVDINVQGATISPFSDKIRTKKRRINP
jgi:hypothetical protein